MNRKTLFISAAIVVVLAGIFVAKKIWFPTIQNVWFQLDRKQLEAAPANLVVFRETRLGNRKPGCQVAWTQRNRSGEAILRYSGRNVPLQEIIPLAYECQPADVVMPPVAPTTHYDFLVTAVKDPAERLRTAFEKQTGFAAGWQESESDVWLLKVQTPGVLQPSTNSSPNVEFKNGILLFTHMPISTLVGFLQQNGHLTRPLQDNTELPGSYDFSLSFNWNTREPLDEKTLRQILQKMGLTVSDGTAPRRMMVVHRK